MRPHPDMDEWAEGVIGAHTCPGCDRLVPDTQLTCNGCWPRVPSGLRSRILDTQNDVEQTRYAHACLAAAIWLRDHP